MSNNLDKAICELHSLVSVSHDVDIHSKTTILIKYGGAAMDEPGVMASVAKSLALLHELGIKIIIVHGGGPQINQNLKRFNLKSEFFRGMRITDSETMQVVQMTLGGIVNDNIVGLLNSFGAKAVGLNGIDAELLICRKYLSAVDLGQVGEVEQVNSVLLSLLLENNFVPVIAPIGKDKIGNIYNINADWTATAIAQNMKVDKLFFLTNTQGIIAADGVSLKSISKDQAIQLMESGIVAGGMLPKIECALEATDKGVARVEIIDARVPLVLLKAMFTDLHTGTIINK